MIGQSHIAIDIRIYNIFIFNSLFLPFVLFSEAIFGITFRHYLGRYVLFEHFVNMNILIHLCVCSCVRVYVCVYIYNAAMEIATRKKLTWGIFGDTKSTDPESTSDF